jgi:hypothetical protein
VETGTVARTYPWSAGTLIVEGGVPFGVVAAAAVTFSTAGRRNKNRHMCWYGTSGAAKVYSLRVLLSRERFAKGVRIYGIDQDEQQEYAGRFGDYLGGSCVPIRTLADAAPFEFPAVVNAAVLIWDLHESDERDRGALFATLKTKLVAHLLKQPGRAAFVVDEAVTVTEDELGARTPGRPGAPRPALRPRGARTHPARDRPVRHAHRAHDPERRGLEVVRPDGAARAARDRAQPGAQPRGNATGSTRPARVRGCWSLRITRMWSGTGIGRHAACFLTCGTWQARETPAGCAGTCSPWRPCWSARS